MRLVLGDQEYEVRNARRPRFNQRRGTWDRVGGLRFSEAETADVWCETTWGHWLYFEHAGRWYRVRHTIMLPSWPVEAKLRAGRLRKANT